jgi:hypothetical protein
LASSDPRPLRARRWFRNIVRVAVVAVAGLGSAAFMAWMVAFPGQNHTGPPGSAPAQVTQRLRAHVTALATTIGPRTHVTPGSLDAAAAYIRGTWTAQGHTVESESFRLDRRTVENLVVTIPGSSPELVVIGAHYDTHPGSPGADDNASGVAALLELGRALRGSRPRRTIRLVAFVNEEYPFARTDAMGSVVHAQRARARGDVIHAMVSLESLGNYSDEPGSQVTPGLFRPFFPAEGNFVAFMGDLKSRDDVIRSMSAFREHAEVPSHGLSAPGWLAGTYRSDHWAFWLEGYPGVMVTDTAPYRYADYHEDSDTAEKLEYPTLAAVVVGLTGMTLTLAGRH